MQAINTLFPVFFMLGLGYISKIKGWLSTEQKAGANSLVFSILFPILVFSLLASAQIQLETVGVILYVTIAFALAIVIGRKLHNLIGNEKVTFHIFSCPLWKVVLWLSPYIYLLSVNQVILLFLI